MKKKQRLTRSDRRVQLMEVARKIFASKGYDASSAEEIASRAGVSKPIVYEHFGSKEGLYAAIVEREMDDLVGRVTQSFSSGSPRDRFEGAVLAFMTYAKENPDGFAVLSRDSPTTIGRRGLTRLMDDLAQQVSDLFRGEFEEAGYNAKVAPIYANALVGMVTQVVQWWASEGRTVPVDHVARHLGALGWMGLRHLPKDPIPPSGGKGASR